MRNRITLQVNCYSGSTALERPISFTLGGKKFNVEEVVDRWYGPDYRHFKVRADDGNMYILRYDERTDEWDMEWYRKMVY
ncbi:MAG: hypothetical protein A2176_04280 [Spirochaetes bacterium RBG_13_51_14]|nr:MAG: hypothetical protein A2176_04280 [Spirochaetes bacterium RBG_13_51_14]